MEVAAAAVGFVSLTFSSFQSCVQAFEFFYTAQHMGADGDLFIARLQWEQYRLLEWGRKAGLEQGSKPTTQLNWQLARVLLEQLEILLTSAELLKNTYRLHVTEEDIDAKERAIAESTPLTGIAKLISKLKPEIYTTRGRIIQGNNNASKRLRWATFGKEQANSVMHDISDFNWRLHQLLDSAEQAKGLQIDANLLRNVLSRSATASEVEQIQSILDPSSSTSPESIRAAATLKQIKLSVGSKEVKSTMPMIRKLSYKRLTAYTIDVPLQYKGIELANYRGEAVLVEWKVAEGAMWAHISNQVKCLVTILASPAGKSSQSLLCLGYLAWEERELYALVFEIPDDTEDGETDQWSLKSLRDLILEQKHFSLNRRFEIARIMADVVLQLHTVGWLHKSLRSENIIFLSPNGSTSNDFLCTPPYLVGYEYARPDTTSGAIFTQLPDTEITTDLYRHPLARGMGRETYRKQFDMYSLGCILMELGMWQSLFDIKTSYMDPDLDDKINEATSMNKQIDLPSLLDLPAQHTVLQKLEHCAGKTFVEAVLCGISIERSDNEASLDVQLAVIEKLQQCKC